VFAISIDKALGGLRRHDIVVLVTIYESDLDSIVIISGPPLNADQTHLIEIYDGLKFPVSLVTSQLKESAHIRLPPSISRLPWCRFNTKPLWVAISAPEKWLSTKSRSQARDMGRISNFPFWHG
jgi:hypothetical protein